MAIARTILALLIAVSVVLLPIGGGAMMGMPAADMSAPTSASISADEPMDCCPNPAKQSEKSVGDCCAMAICAFKCFGGSEATFSLAPPSVLADLLLPFATDQFRSQAAHPPFRPPRV
jgi:hypothetical protein